MQGVGVGYWRVKLLHWKIRRYKACGMLVNWLRLTFVSSFKFEGNMSEHKKYGVNSNSSLCGMLFSLE
ncbi:hypothetical protein L1887_34740 [Cichorium endivia]|nr:hypothetical protein L1887_34740 [Cichorium endivia]